MSKRKKKAARSGSGASPLAPIVESAQLAIGQGVQAKVVGEAVTVEDVVQRAGVLPGIFAIVRRGDRTYEVSLADVEPPPTSPLADAVGRYRELHGVPPGARGDTAAPPEVEELAVLCVLDGEAACCDLRSSETVLLGGPDVEEHLFPAEILRVPAAKRGRGRNAPVCGDSALDVARLGLEPLRLEPRGKWDPAEAELDEGAPTPEWLRRVLERGPREAYALEDVAPTAGKRGAELDLLLQAEERLEADDVEGAREALMGALLKDLRALAAHATLGDLAFDDAPERAIRHYEAGVRIAELSVPAEFDGVLPWAALENRPFLRCLHGYGLCLWRLGRTEDALAAFERLLWLNPIDNQGARFLVEPVRAGETWERFREREERERHGAPVIPLRVGDDASAPVTPLRTVENAPPLAPEPPVPVDLPALMIALEDNDGGHAWYLDRQTGDTIFVPEFDFDDDDDDLPVPREELEDSPRFVLVDPVPSYEAYEDMVAFAETANGRLRSRLEDALKGKGAFGRFKRVLESAPEERERWFRFKDERLERRAREWLEAEGIVVAPREPGPP